MKLYKAIEEREGERVKVRYQPATDAELITELQRRGVLKWDTHWEGARLCTNWRYVKEPT